MSGLMRSVIDQVLQNMGEDERAQQVAYVTDRMIEKMDTGERVALLLAIIDRVMSNLSPQERADVATRVTTMIGEQAASANQTRDASGASVTGSQATPDQ